MKEIFVYSGMGAYQAKDIENFLSVFNFDYERICEHKLEKLMNNSIFIVPGGKISDYLPSWGSGGIKKIKDFLNNGGIFVGICAGVYVSGKTFNGSEGLNLIEQNFDYEKSFGIIKAKYGKEEIELVKENGPKLPNDAGEIIIKDENNDTQAIKIQLGLGAAYLFASHPEGSTFYNLPPKSFSGARFFSKFLKGL